MKAKETITSELGLNPETLFYDERDCDEVDFEFKELNNEIARIVDGNARNNENIETCSSRRESNKSIVNGLTNSSFDLMKEEIWENKAKNEDTDIFSMKYNHLAQRKEKKKTGFTQKVNNAESDKFSFFSPIERHESLMGKAVTPQLNGRSHLSPFMDIKNPHLNMFSFNYNNDSSTNSPNFLMNRTNSTLDTQNNQLNYSPEYVSLTAGGRFYNNNKDDNNNLNLQHNNNFVFSPNNNTNDEVLLNRMIDRKSSKQSKTTQIHGSNFNSNNQRTGVNYFDMNQERRGSHIMSNNFNKMNPNLMNSNQIMQGKAQTPVIQFSNHNQFYQGKPKNKTVKLKENPLDCLRTTQDTGVKSKRDHLDDEHNRISLENIIKKKDKRTTVMIRHIPNKYNINSFLEEINQDFKNKYDLFYLPIDYMNNCNLGFAFINFVDPMHIVSFYDNFRGKKWKKFNSDKICELAFAKFQGKKDLIAHFEKGSVMNFQTEDKRPLILPTPDPLPKVEIPLKFLEAFITIYPYSLYTVMPSNDKFQVEAYYNF